MQFFSMGSEGESAPLLSAVSFNDGLEAPSTARLSSHNLEEFGTAFIYQPWGLYFKGRRHALACIDR